MYRTNFLLTLLLLAILGSAQTGILGGIPTVDYNTAANKGQFIPATSLTANVSQYQSYKYGWLICYGMNTYNGHFWDQVAQTPPPPTMFNPQNVDVQKWADSAAANGVQYAALTVFNEYGFLLYPSEVAYNMPRISLASGYSPYYTAPYCVQPGIADTSIVTKFVNIFSAKGIEPVIYLAYGWNMNLMQNTFGQLWSGGNADRYELFVKYYCKVIQEMAIKFPRVKYYWIDLATGSIPQANIQRLYNALKAVRPDAVFIGNVQGETNFGRFPYDIQSTEEYAAYNNPSIISTTSRTFGGAAYYVGQEIVGTPYSVYSQWYYYDPLCPDQPVTNPMGSPAGYVKMAAVADTTFQNLVNNARSYSRPFLAAMLVDRNGNLVQENLDYLRRINFY